MCGGAERLQPMRAASDSGGRAEGAVYTQEDSGGGGGGDEWQRWVRRARAALQAQEARVPRPQCWTRGALERLCMVRCAQACCIVRVRVLG